MVETVIGLVAFVVTMLSIIFGLRCAYFNGVTDGYGYSQEPSCPGYWIAGRMLKTYMYHRWSNVKDPTRESRRYMLLKKSHWSDSPDAITVTVAKNISLAGLTFSGDRLDAELDRLLETELQTEKEQNAQDSDT